MKGLICWCVVAAVPLLTATSVHAADPKIEFREAPTAGTGQVVSTKIKWSDSPTIKKITIEMFKRGDGTEYSVLIGSTEFNTTQASGNADKTVTPTAAQPSNTMVKIVIKSISLDGTTVLDDETSGVITLP